MIANMNEIIKEFQDLLPQMHNLLNNSDSFTRYILPSIIAGIISIAGITINNIVSLAVFKKKRSLEYGKFYLPYLLYLKKIQCEIELLSEEEKKDLLIQIIENVVCQKNNFGLNEITKYFHDIDSLFKSHTYYIINRRINKEVLTIQTFIAFLNRCEEKGIEDNELIEIKKCVGELKIDIKEHIRIIERHS